MWNKTTNNVQYSSLPVTFANCSLYKLSIGVLCSAKILVNKVEGKNLQVEFNIYNLMMAIRMQGRMYT